MSSSAPVNILACRSATMGNAFRDRHVACHSREFRAPFLFPFSRLHVPVVVIAAITTATVATVVIVIVVVVVVVKHVDDDVAITFLIQKLVSLSISPRKLVAINGCRFPRVKVKFSTDSARADVSSAAPRRPVFASLVSLALTHDVRRFPRCSSTQPPTRLFVT